MIAFTFQEENEVKNHVSSCSPQGMLQPKLLVQNLAHFLGSTST